MIEFFHKLINDHSMNIGDAGAGGITLAALTQLIPTVTATLSGIWVALRIYVLIRDEIINRKEKKDGHE